MSGIDLLRRIGEALYGERWQSPLARDLAVAVRTVQRWAIGDTPIPQGVWSDLNRLLTARARDIETLRRALVEGSGAEEEAAAAAWHRTRDEEAVPVAVVDRLLAGDNPVRVWREHRGISLAALAAAAGVGKGYLSQIETGERQGPVQTLKRIAAALRVDLDDLV